jgi:FMN-dependent dehydrogenase/Histidine phosphatase superfamily (branch 1)
MGSNSTALSSSQVVNIEDLRRMAYRRLPRVVFDYLDGGAESEITLRENTQAFEDIYLRPRSAVAFPDCDLRVRVLGHDLAFPAILGPLKILRKLRESTDLGLRDLETPLTKHGHLQALETGRYLSGRYKFDVIYSSPYHRALQRLKTSPSALLNPPRLVIEERIREIEFGILDGLNAEGIR